jgi:hypothetical protein
MNIRLRNSLSALVIAASLVSLGYAIGEPPRPSDLIFDASGNAVAALPVDCGIINAACLALGGVDKLSR